MAFTARALASVETQVKILLKESGTTYWSSNEVTQVGEDVVREVSIASPRTVIDDTLKTVAGSRIIDVSSIEDLVNGIDSIKKVEYKIDQWPKHFRNFAFIDGDHIELDVTTAPGDIFPVRITCHKLHLLDTGSTLTAQLETLVIEGMAARLMLQWLQNMRVEITNALTVIAEANTAIDLVTARVTQMVTDISSGRTETAKISALIDLAATEIALINPEVDKAVTEVGLANAEADKAVLEVPLANIEIDKAAAEVALANAEIDLAVTETAQAVTDLDSGRAVIGSVTAGHDQAARYGDYSRAGVGNAQGMLGQAQGYLGTAQGYMGVSPGYLGTTNGYLGTSNGFLRTANGYVGTANGFFLTMRAFLEQAKADESASANYIQLAAVEGQAGLRDLGKAQGYMSEATSRLNTARAMKVVEDQANQRLASYLRKLNNLRPRPQRREWAKT